MTRLIDAELLTSKISYTGFPHTDRNGRIDKSWVYYLINSCPTIDKRQQGEWIRPNSWEEGYKGVVCSRCGKKFDIIEWSPAMLFCYNCGADMREELRKHFGKMEYGQ